MHLFFSGICYSFRCQDVLQIVSRRSVSRFNYKVSSSVNKPICNLRQLTVEKKTYHVIYRLRVGPYGEKLDLELEKVALGLWHWAALLN